jgi:RIP metalloprotease RseP
MPGARQSSEDPVAGFVIIVGVILMVVIHEGAHFVAAKSFDMKATEAFFGFGPRLWSTHRGETEYGVKAIPLGGYVRIIGMNPFEEVDAAEEERTYRSKPFGQKAIVVLAGITSHFVVAFVLFWIVAVTWGTALMPEPYLSPTVTNVGKVLIESDVAVDAVPLELEAGDEIVAIGGRDLLDVDPLSSVEPGDLITVDVARDGAVVTLETTDRVVPTPAFQAGALEGDRILEVGGEPIRSWDDFTREAQERPGEATSVLVERDGAEVTLSAILTVRTITKDGTDTPVGFFGVAPDDQVGPFRAVVASADNLVVSTREAARGLWSLVSNFGSILTATVTNDGDSLEESRPISVIGLVQIASQLEESFILLAFVNVFVGLLNVIPLYPLDGGHFSVALYEKLRGRPADVRKLLPVAAAVFIFVLTLGLLGIYLDIFNPLEIPGR